MESWRELQKEELEYQYSPSRWSPRMDKDAVIEAHVRLTSEGTKKSQSMTETLLNVPYGALEGEKMDIYLPLHSSGAFPFFIYVHGGYWQFLSGLYLCGHSAGAHLVAMALSTDWTDYGVKPEIKGAFLVSGVYDLLPITHTYVNAPLCMSEEIAVRNSPMQHVREVKSQAETCRIVVVLAEHDTAEFCRQSQEYSQNLQALGLNVCLRDINGVDHFDVIEKLSQEDYVLTQIILNMILRE
ncbi:kynurenine formamidase isoform X2 [Rhinatrema bivittatum]|uniref:kynurenine formamidase isoform X2 n=1 Tax=Rhinatrema bivittatum TaxID=194408 RepID=UPI00112C1579|nr:kynurenine formamidase isoform X2 [Rhinatrema bivittatum]